MRGCKNPGTYYHPCTPPSITTAWVVFPFSAILELLFVWKPPCLVPPSFLLQLYTAVLVLEELEKKALTLVEEERQAELLAKKEEVTTQAFALLRLKPAHETSTRWVWSVGVATGLLWSWCPSQG